MPYQPNSDYLFPPDASTETGYYGRDVLYEGKFFRLELLPELLGPALEVFDVDEPLNPKLYEGRTEDLVVLVEDDEFALKAVEFAKKEIETGIV